MYAVEKPRILIFIGSLRSGGKERRLIELLTYLKAKDLFEILVVMTKNEIHYKGFYNLNINYKVIRKKWKKNDVTVFYQFYKICKQYNPHIVHSWGRMQSFYTIPVVIGQKRPLVNSQITGAPSRLKGWTVNRLIDMINFRFSKVVLANSRKGFEVFKPPPKKQKLIFNGINLARFENLPPVEDIKRKYGIVTSHAVVMIATFSPAKDYNLFFSIAQKVTSIRDDISFIGVGGYDKDDLGYKRMSELSSENPKIIFQGRIQDVEALINACTIGVLFSTNGEGTSNSILEYMALGKPVIANNAGGTCELIRNGENGYLIANETADEIGNLIIELIDDAEKAEMFGAISKKRIREEFSLDIMGKAFETVYNDTLAYENVNEEIGHSILTNKI
jgi:glycosyltransferase involved in cell wall biosynthesis